MLNGRSILNSRKTTGVALPASARRNLVLGRGERQVEKRMRLFVRVKREEEVVLWFDSAAFVRVSDLCGDTAEPLDPVWVFYTHYFSHMTSDNLTANLSPLA